MDCFVDKLWCSSLKGCTENVIFSIKKEALRTNYVNFHTDKTTKLLICRICGVENKKSHAHTCSYVHCKGTSISNGE